MNDLLEQAQATAPWLLPAFFALIGGCVGSFLNVCIFRIPVGASVVVPGSHCACGRPIHWYDNLPVFSWLILRGRARCCGRPFSARYPAVELLTAALFLAAWLRFADSPGRAFCAMLFTSLLIAASFIDLDHMIIPDRFSIGGAVVGVALSLAVPSLHLSAGAREAFIAPHFASALAGTLGALVGSATVLWIGELAGKVLRKEAMGFGDVKLMGCIGAFCGWQGALFSIFGGALIGSVILLPLLICKRLRRSPAESTPAEPPPADDDAPAFGRETPFGPMLCAGALLYLLWLEPWVDGYFENLAFLFR